MVKILETARLLVRELTIEDMGNLKKTLQDEKAMVAYEHAFDDEEVKQWLQKQLYRYEQDGFGLWALIRKSDGTFIGQCGLTMQNVDGEELLEIGYLLQRAYWHQGYAIEAASAIKDYAFSKLHAPIVYSIIRDTNTASIQVALRNGMHPLRKTMKHYYRMDMPHIIYGVQNPQFEKGNAA